MQKMKRILAAMLVALTLLSCNVTGFAATKPTASLVSKSASTVKRGKKLKVTYRLNSGSYKKKNGVWRSRFTQLVDYKSIGGTRYGVSDDVFTGNFNYIFTWKINKSLPTGKYYLVYGTFYRKNASASWTVNTAKSTTFKVKK